MNTTDICVKNVSFATEDYAYRSPIKFGGVVLDRVTLLETVVEVESRQGRRSIGRGCMPLGNVWAFPSRVHSYDETLRAMLQVAERVAKIYAGSALFGHPIDITHQIEQSFFEAAAEETQRLQLGQPIPRLATLVAASPFDAALHDAFGKLHGVSVYHTYGPDFLDNDLGRFFGSDFRGVRIHEHLMRDPIAELPLYHLVGALDSLESTEDCQPIGDGLPENLSEWIRWNGLTHLKIKLNGDDLEWDVGRLLDVERVASEAQVARGVTTWYYSLDFNERCQDVAYLLSFIERIQRESASAFQRIAYIEQPTARDLKAHHENRMHAASSLVPVVIDESLLDLESLLQACELGYTGVALKACKGQTQSVLLACAARHLKMFLCVQDLTCPGASLIHSAGLAAHVKGVTAIEANSRQYCPDANAAWAQRFPGVFEIRNGMMRTGLLIGPGLGAYPVDAGISI